MLADLNTVEDAPVIDAIDMFGAAPDTVVLQTMPDVSGMDPTPDAAPTDGSAITCRFAYGETTIESEDGAEAEVSDAQVRLPAGTTVVSSQRVKLTHKDGTELSTAEIYAIMGEPIHTRELSGGADIEILCYLQTVPGDSEK